MAREANAPPGGGGDVPPLRWKRGLLLYFLLQLAGAVLFAWGHGHYQPRAGRSGESAGVGPETPDLSTRDLVGWDRCTKHEGEKVDPAEARGRAAVLYREGSEREARRDYYGAVECYERSVQLYEDEEVEAAYRRLIWKIGPR